MKQKIFGISIVALMFLSAIAQAQTDTIRPGSSKFRFENLPLKTTTYAVYREDSATGKMISQSIWVRSLQKTSWKEQQVYQFDWKVYARDSMIAKVQDILDAKTFAPLYHNRQSTRGNVDYIFENGRMTSTASADNNPQSAKNVTLEPFPFNWEVDMETFVCFPISKTGQRFVVPFFDPSGDRPAWQSYVVAGEEKLSLPGGAQVDCWILRHEPFPGSYGQWWIAKKSHIIVKMKEYFRGVFRYKVLLY